MLFILNIYFFSESATDTFSPSSQVRSLSLIAQKRLWGHKGGGTLQGCCWNIEAHKRGCGEDLKAVCSGQRPYGVDKGRMEWVKAVWSGWRPYGESEGRMEWVKAVWCRWRPHEGGEGPQKLTREVCDGESGGRGRGRPPGHKRAVPQRAVRTKRIVVYANSGV